MATLSPVSIETLDDLLILRIESFLVTNPKEAMQLAVLHRCREELSRIGKDSSDTRSVTAQKARTEDGFPIGLPRRLQREIKRLNQVGRC